jgi:hypothetical protein
MYFLNHLSQTGFHGRQHVNSRIALFSKSLTHPSVYAYILSKLLIMLMGFPRRAAAFYMQSAHECTQH